jgi:hypothetical protein
MWLLKFLLILFSAVVCSGSYGQLLTLVLEFVFPHTRQNGRAFETSLSDGVTESEIYLDQETDEKPSVCDITFSDSEESDVKKTRR